MFALCSQEAASFEFSWYSVLPLRSFLAAMKLTSCGLSSLGSFMSSNAVLALATKFFSDRSERAVLVSDLSEKIRSCLSELRLFATTSATSGLMAFWAMVAYVIGAGVIGWVVCCEVWLVLAPVRGLSLIMSITDLAWFTTSCRVLDLASRLLVMSSSFCLMV